MVKLQKDYLLIIIKKLRLWKVGADSDDFYPYGAFVQIWIPLGRQEGAAGPGNPVGSGMKKDTQTGLLLLVSPTKGHNRQLSRTSASTHYPKS